jgi:hypothetical protein
VWHELAAELHARRGDLGPALVSIPRAVAIGREERLGPVGLAWLGCVEAGILLALGDRASTAALIGDARAVAAAAGLGPRAPLVERIAALAGGQPR